MKRLMIAMLYVLLPMFVVAQQERSFQIDENSFEPEQKGVLEGVDIDKIAHDYSNRPCARIKLHINRMSQEDISQVSVKTVGGNVVIMKSEVATEGNGLIIELTARPNVRLYLHHDKYGDSNEVTLNLEADKVYKLEAQLSLQYSIAVNTNFVGADVYIDGNYKGKTDASFGLTINDIPSGLHTLRVVYGTAYNEKQIEVSSTNIYFRIELNTTTSLPQYVVFEVEPKEAIVVIDHKSYVPDSEGIVTIRLNNGSYEYQISAKDYHPEKGVFMVEGAKVKRQVTLKPAFGYVSIEASPIVDGANVYIDDNFVGRAPLKSDKLSSGAHRIKIIKELYLPVEESIVISDNEVLEYRPTLTADFATVSLSVEGGADIYVNDSYKGNSTWRGNLATGAYVFEARKAGHRPTQLNQEIRATATTKSYTLAAPTPILGTLDIQSTPSNAAVYVDGQHVGDTPLMVDVLVGSHTIKVKRDGYAENSETVTISEGTVESLNVKLSKATNEIYYTTTDGRPVTIMNKAFDAKIISHTYDGGGVIKFDKPIMTIGDSAFSGCSSLTSITIPDGVTSIEYCAFYGCSSLTSITIPDGVTSIEERAFYGCSSLTSITIPDGVTSIEERAFYGCSSLTSVTIPDSVTTIGDYAFYSCASLTSVTIPDSVTTIGYSAFSDCDSLTSLTIPDSVTTIGTIAFHSCDSLKEFKGKFASVDGRCWVVDEKLIFFAQCGLTEYTIPDGVTSIGESAFSYCDSLVSVTIPDSVTTIGDFAFGECESLTNVIIPDSVTSIGDYAFYYCSSLTSITIPDGVTSIGDCAFDSCSSLTSITIPDGVTSIGDFAFGECESLTNVIIPDSIMTIRYGAFYDCKDLESVYCKATIPPGGANYMFYNNASGRKIYVPKESVDAYKSAKWWSEYADDIVGYDF